MTEFFYDSEDVLETEGKIIFDPTAIKDPSGKMFKEGWVICSLECDITSYYSWFLEKIHGIKLQRPAWGAHISIVRGENVKNDVWSQIKEKYHQKPLKFVYEVSPKTNGEHWWLKVTCEDFFLIRKELCLNPFPKFPYHLTLGVPTPKHIDQSCYIWKCYKSFLSLPENS